MNTTSKWLAIVAVAFVAGSFVASPELRAFAANTVGSSDIIDGQVKTADLASNAVTAAKIKDNEVKAAEIATDAVGAAEIQGVTKLLFAQCNLTAGEADFNVSPRSNLLVFCTVNGVDRDDSVSATFNDGTPCFHAQVATAENNEVLVHLYNDCDTSSKPAVGSSIALVIYDK